MGLVVVCICEVYGVDVYIDVGSLLLLVGIIVCGFEDCVIGVNGLVGVCIDEEGVIVIVV